MRRIRKDANDGKSTLNVATGESSPRFLVVNGARLYWTSNRGVSTAPADAGSAARLLCDETTTGSGAPSSSLSMLDSFAGNPGRTHGRPQSTR